MKVLVTGANGFLGSWLCRALLKEGHQVSALVRKNSDISELTGLSIEYVYGDVTDFSSVLKSIDGVDTVFHLAGVVAYKKSDTPLMEKVNVGGTKNVVDACLQKQIPKLVYVSSVVAIGAGFSPTEILDEKSEYNIAHLGLGYFDTKHTAEKYVLEACKTKGLHAVAVNPATIYGAGDAKKGSRSNQIKVARGSVPVYPSGGVNVVPVQDVVDGILSAWKNGRNGERYILSGENMTIKHVFEIIADEAGVTAPQYKLPNSLFFSLGYLGDVLFKLGLKFPLTSDNAWTATMFHWFSNDKAVKELGFHPGSAEAAIRQSVQWMKKHGYLEK